MPQVRNYNQDNGLNRVQIRGFISTLTSTVCQNDNETFTTTSTKRYAPKNACSKSERLRITNFNARSLISENIFVEVYLTRLEKIK